MPTPMPPTLCRTDRTVGTMERHLLLKSLHIVGAVLFINGATVFVLSGVIWLAVLMPLQTQLGRMAKTFSPGRTIPDRYWRLGRWWLASGNCLYGVFGVKRFLLAQALDDGCTFPALWHSVTGVTARRRDVGQGCKVEFDDRFERLSRGTVAQAVGECREPISIFCL